MHHVFGGYMAHIVRCGGCGAASRRCDAAFDAVLDVRPGVATLEGALAAFCAGECFFFYCLFLLLIRAAARKQKEGACHHHHTHHL